MSIVNFDEIGTHLIVDRIELNNDDFDVSVTRPLMAKYKFPKNVYCKYKPDQCVIPGKVRILDFWARMINGYGTENYVNLSCTDLDVLAGLSAIDKPIAYIYCTEVGELPDEFVFNMDWIKIDFSLFREE